MSEPTPSGSPRRVPNRSLWARLRYSFDAAFSRGPSVVIAWLGALTLAVIFIASLLLTILRLTGINGETESKHGLAENFWLAMTRVLDPGTFSGELTWPTRIVMLFVTLSGVFIAGSLIGLIASAVDQRVEELRKGRSNVIEEDHTLILGWSARVPAIVSELVIANESRKKAAIVVMANIDKTEIEEALRSAITNWRTTRLVCRSGEPWVQRNLESVNVHGARSVVIVGGDDDTATVKTLLALRSCGGETGELGANVVAEVTDSGTAQSLKSLFGGGLVTVNSDSVVAELTAQACRQRGLSGVFRELLDFDGDELYFAPFPTLVGRTYAQLQLSFERSAVVGVMHADGQVQLNPAPDAVFVDEDQLIAVAEDDSLFLPCPPVPAVVREMEATVPGEVARRIVIVGWSSLGPRVVAELDEFFDARTTIEVLLDPALVDVDQVRASLTASNLSLEVNELGGGPEVVAAHAAKRSFHEVIVLGYRKVLGDDQADARTLLTLLAFNQVRQQAELGPVRIVAEMLDQRNAHLAEATGVDDFVVSDELTSLMLAQLSERAELHHVFEDLFDREGCSIELRSAPAYGAHLAATFADVVATASTMGHSAIGYRRASSGEVVVNPAKSSPLHLERDDEVLVIAAGIAAGS